MFEPTKYAGLLGILGAILVSAAVQAAQSGPPLATWGLIVTVAYIGLSLLALAVAYLLNALGVHLDAVHGARGGAWVTGALFLPYRVAAGLVCIGLRRFDSMGPMHSVGPRIYVGRIPLPHERSALMDAGVTSVLNLCVEFPRLSRIHESPGLEAAYIPMLDGTAPSRAQWNRAIDWIVRRHAEGHTILVHCAQGRGRSVTVAAAALCRLGFAIGPDEALAQIRAARPKACPSLMQRVSLSAFLGSA